MISQVSSTAVLHGVVSKLLVFSDAVEPIVECKTTSTGGDYKGFQSVTVNGHICQRWDMQVM